MNSFNSYFKWFKRFFIVWVIIWAIITVAILSGVGYLGYKAYQHISTNGFVLPTVKVVVEKE